MSISISHAAQGGTCLRLINKTGSASVKGSVVSASTGTDFAFILQANQYDAIGIVLEAGIADGDWCWIVISGAAEVLFKDTVAPVHGYWVFSADTDGRADNAVAPGGVGFPGTTDEHFKEVGHCLESKAGGTNVLAWCLVHFN